MAFGKHGAEAHFALALPDEALQAGDDDDVAARVTDKTPHQLSCRPPGRPVIEADVGHAAALRQIRNHGDDRQLGRNRLYRRGNQLMVGQDDDQRVLRAGNLAQHLRRFVRRLHVEVVERGLETGAEVERIGPGERLAQHFIEGIRRTLHDDADAQDARWPPLEIAVDLQLARPFEHAPFLLGADAAAPVEYAIDGRRADAGRSGNIGDDGFLLHD